MFGHKVYVAVTNFLSFRREVSVHATPSALTYGMRPAFILLAFMLAFAHDVTRAPSAHAQYIACTFTAGSGNANSGTNDGIACVGTSTASGNIGTAGGVTFSQIITDTGMGSSINEELDLSIHNLTADFNTTGTGHGIQIDATATGSVVNHNLNFSFQNTLTGQSGTFRDIEVQGDGTSTGTGSSAMDAAAIYLEAHNTAGGTRNRINDRDLVAVINNNSPGGSAPRQAVTQGVFFAGSNNNLVGIYAEGSAKIDVISGGRIGFEPSSGTTSGFGSGHKAIFVNRTSGSARFDWNTPGAISNLPEGSYDTVITNHGTIDVLGSGSNTSTNSHGIYVTNGAGDIIVMNHGQILASGNFFEFSNTANDTFTTVFPQALNPDFNTFVTYPSILYKEIRGAAQISTELTRDYTNATRGGFEIDMRSSAQICAGEIDTDFYARAVFMKGCDGGQLGNTRFARGGAIEILGGSTFGNLSDAVYVVDALRFGGGTHDFGAGIHDRIRSIGKLTIGGDGGNYANSVNITNLESINLHSVSELDIHLQNTNSPWEVSLGYGLFFEGESAELGRGRTAGFNIHVADSFTVNDDENAFTLIKLSSTGSGGAMKKGEIYGGILPNSAGGLTTGDANRRANLVDNFVVIGSAGSLFDEFVKLNTSTQTIDPNNCPVGFTCPTSPNSTDAEVRMNLAQALVNRLHPSREFLNVLSRKAQIIKGNTVYEADFTFSVTNNGDLQIGWRNAEAVVRSAMVCGANSIDITGQTVFQTHNLNCSTASAAGGRRPIADGIRLSGLYWGTNIPTNTVTGTTTLKEIVANVITLDTFGGNVNSNTTARSDGIAIDAASPATQGVIGATTISIQTSTTAPALRDIEVRGDGYGTHGRLIRLRASEIANCFDVANNRFNATASTCGTARVRNILAGQLEREVDAAAIYANFDGVGQSLTIQNGRVSAGEIRSSDLFFKPHTGTSYHDGLAGMYIRGGYGTVTYSGSNNATRTEADALTLTNYGSIGFESTTSRGGTGHRGIYVDMPFDAGGMVTISNFGVINVAGSSSDMRSVGFKVLHEGLGQPEVLGIDRGTATPSTETRSYKRFDQVITDTITVDEYIAQSFNRIDITNYGVVDAGMGALLDVMTSPETTHLIPNLNPNKDFDRTIVRAGKSIYRHLANSSTSSSRGGALTGVGDDTICIGATSTAPVSATPDDRDACHVASYTDANNTTITLDLTHAYMTSGKDEIINMGNLILSGARQVVPGAVFNPEGEYPDIYRVDRQTLRPNETAQYALPYPNAMIAAHYDFGGYSHFYRTGNSGARSPVADGASGGTRDSIINYGRLTIGSPTMNARHINVSGLDTLRLKNGSSLTIYAQGTREVDALNLAATVQGELFKLSDLLNPEDQGGEHVFIKKGIQSEEQFTRLLAQLGLRLTSYVSLEKIAELQRLNSGSNFRTYNAINLGDALKPLLRGSFANIELELEAITDSGTTTETFHLADLAIHLPMTSFVHVSGAATLAVGQRVTLLNDTSGAANNSLSADTATIHIGSRRYILSGVTLHNVRSTAPEIIGVPGNLLVNAQQASPTNMPLARLEVRWTGVQEIVPQTALSCSYSSPAFSCSGGGTAAANEMPLSEGIHISGIFKKASQTSQLTAATTININNLGGTVNTATGFDGIYINTGIADNVITTSLQTTGALTVNVQTGAAQTGTRQNIEVRGVAGSERIQVRGFNAAALYVTNNPSNNNNSADLTVNNGGALVFRADSNNNNRFNNYLVGLAVEHAPSQATVTISNSGHIGFEQGSSLAQRGGEHHRGIYVHKRGSSQTLTINNDGVIDVRGGGNGSVGIFVTGAFANADTITVNNRGTILANPDNGYLFQADRDGSGTFRAALTFNHLSSTEARGRINFERAGKGVLCIGWRMATSGRCTTTEASQVSTNAALELTEFYADGFVSSSNDYVAIVNNGTLRLTGNSYRLRSEGASGRALLNNYGRLIIGNGFNSYANSVVFSAKNEFATPINDFELHPNSITELYIQGPSADTAWGATYEATLDGGLTISEFISAILIHGATSAATTPTIIIRQNGGNVHPNACGTPPCSSFPILRASNVVSIRNDANNGNLSGTALTTALANLGSKARLFIGNNEYGGTFGFTISRESTDSGGGRRLNFTFDNLTLMRSARSPMSCSYANNVFNCSGGNNEAALALGIDSGRILANLREDGTTLSYSGAVSFNINNLAANVNTTGDGSGITVDALGGLDQINQNLTVNLGGGRTVFVNGGSGGALYARASGSNSLTVNNNADLTMTGSAGMPSGILATGGGLVTVNHNGGTISSAAGAGRNAIHVMRSGAGGVARINNRASIQMQGAMNNAFTVTGASTADIDINNYASSTRVSGDVFNYAGGATLTYTQHAGSATGGINTGTAATNLNISAGASFTMDKASTGTGDLTITNRGTLNLNAATLTFNGSMDMLTNHGRLVIGSHITPASSVTISGMENITIENNARLDLYLADLATTSAWNVETLLIKGSDARNTTPIIAFYLPTTTTLTEDSTGTFDFIIGSSALTVDTAQTGTTPDLSQNYQNLADRIEFFVGSIRRDGTFVIAQSGNTLSVTYSNLVLSALTTLNCHAVGTDIRCTGGLVDDIIDPNDSSIILRQGLGRGLDERQIFRSANIESDITGDVLVNMRQAVNINDKGDGTGIEFDVTSGGLTVAGNVTFNYMSPQLVTVSAQNAFALHVKSQAHAEVNVSEGGLIFRTASDGTFNNDLTALKVESGGNGNVVIRNTQRLGFAQGVSSTSQDHVGIHVTRAGTGTAMITNLGVIDVTAGTGTQAIFIETGSGAVTIINQPSGVIRSSNDAVHNDSTGIVTINNFGFIHAGALNLNTGGIFNNEGGGRLTLGVQGSGGGLATGIGTFTAKTGSTTRLHLRPSTSSGVTTVNSFVLGTNVAFQKNALVVLHSVTAADIITATTTSITASDLFNASNSITLASYGNAIFHLVEGDDIKRLRLDPSSTAGSESFIVGDIGFKGIVGTTALGNANATHNSNQLNDALVRATMNAANSPQSAALEYSLTAMSEILREQVTQAGGITSAAGRQVYSQAVRDIAAPVYGSIIQTNFLAQRQFTQRIASSGCYTDRPKSEEEFAQKYKGRIGCGWTKLWSQALKKNGSSSALGFKEESLVNFMTGLELIMTPKVNLSFSGGMSYINHKGDEGSQGEGYRIHLHTAATFQNNKRGGQGIRASFGVSGGYTLYDMERRVSAFDANFDSNPSMFNYGVFGHVGYRVRTGRGRTVIEPRLGFDLIHIFLQADNEHVLRSGTNPNVQANLSVKESNKFFASVNAAMHMEGVFEYLDAVYRPFGTIGFTYLATDEKINTSSSFVGTSGDLRSEDEIQSFFIDYDLGLNFNASQGVIARISYEGMFSTDGDTSQHGGRLRLSY